MGLVKRKFKCTGCGEDRPFFLEVNQESDSINWYDHTEDLKCVLDETNQTSFNWKEFNPEKEPEFTYKESIDFLERKVKDLRIEIRVWSDPKNFSQKIIDKCEKEISNHQKAIRELQKWKS